MKSRALQGGAGGAIIGLVWYQLGVGAVLVMLAAGALGFAVGWVLDNPRRVIELFERLEGD